MGGGQLERQWPGLGHAECYICRVSEKSPSKAVRKGIEGGKTKAAPLEGTVSVWASPQAPPGVCWAQLEEEADFAPPS